MLQKISWRKILTGWVILRLSLIAAITMVAHFEVKAQAGTDADGLEPYKFLIGEWVGELRGEPGIGETSIVFSSGLGGNIIQRKGSAKFEATKDQPATTHDDFMVIYHGAGQTILAVYWDNQGHTINYSTHISPNKDTLTFISDVMPNQPRFRLTYVKIAPDSLSNVFEFATPNQPELFKPHVEGRLVKKR